jgi:xylan 1,4-beta-xylosidase
MYENPILRGVNPDPSICRVGEDYYLVTSSFRLFPGVPIYHSRDLVNWRMLGHVLDRPEQFLLDKCNRRPHLYAATIRHHDGLFYLITTNVEGGGNFYVTARDPAGPWSDPIVVDEGVFDPSLMFDDDGTVYYTRRGPMEDKTIVQATIDIKTGKLTSALKPIGQGMVSDDSEGPHLYKINGWYYLSLGEGGSRALHMQTIGRSRSPWGPFEPCPHNPIIAQHNAWWHPLTSLGHADFVEAHDGSWWVVFLGVRHPHYEAKNVIGRETFLAPVEWKDGWPVVNLQAQRALQVDVPTFAEQKYVTESPRDDFDQPKLGKVWSFGTYPRDGSWSLSERTGYLRLKTACVVGRRMEDLGYRAATRLEFDPADNTSAGLAVYQTDRFQYRLVVARRDYQRVLILEKRIADIIHPAAVVPVPAGPIELRVTGDPRRMTFDYRTEGGQWTEIGTAMPDLIGSEVATSWCGALLSMVAEGDSLTADFDSFVYEPQPYSGSWR